MSQQLSFGFVPAERAGDFITLADDLRAGISYFRAEALRVKSIAEAISTQKVFALMDEPFKGTNVKDALDARRNPFPVLNEGGVSVYVFISPD